VWGIHVISPEEERKGTVGSETKNVVSVFQVLQDSEETLIARGGKLYYVSILSAFYYYFYVKHSCQKLLKFNDAYSGYNLQLKVLGIFLRNTLYISVTFELMF